MNKLVTYIKNKNIVTFVAISLIVAFMPIAADAADGINWGYTPPATNSLFPAGNQPTNANECGVHSSGTRLANACPSGRRFDIDASCIAKQNKNSNNCLDTMPISGTVTRVPEDVCYRSSGTSNNSAARNHNGMDYAADTSAKVLAAADGWVTRRQNTGGGGNTITMVHPRASNGPSPKVDTYTTQYLHLSSFIYWGEICPGARTNACWVKKGTPLGYVGNTGCGNCGNHLHFEIKDSSGNYIDPMCDSIQGLCGGSAMNLTSCRKDCAGREAECIASRASVDGDDEVGVNAAAGTRGDASSYGFNNAAGNAKECRLSSYRESVKTCIFCDPFMILFNTASEIAKNAYDTFAPWVINVVIVAFALWVALKVILFVSAMEVKDPRVMIKELLTQAFVVLVVVLILDTELQSFLKMIIEPIFSTGFRLARYAMNGIACTNDYGITETGGLPVSMGNDIVCTVKAIQDHIVDIMAVGSLLICISWFKESILNVPLFLHWGYFLSGLGVWIGAVLLMIVYPWLLIDVMLKLCVAMALMPAAIGSYAFKVTRKHSGKIFEAIMSAMFTFVFLTIIIYMVTQQLVESLKDLVEPLKETGDDTDNVTFLRTILWSGEMFLRVLFISLLGVSVMDSVKDFTGYFVQSGINIKPIGSPTGGAAASFGKAIAKGAGGAAVKFGKPHAASGLGKAKFVANKLHMDYKSWRINRKNTNIDANGNPIAGEAKTKERKSWIRRRDVQSTETRGVGGRRIISKIQITAMKKKTIQTQNDNWIKFRTIRTQNGTIKETSELIKGGGSFLVKDDGTTVDHHIDQVIRNSAFDENKAHEAVLRALVDDLMPGIHAAKFLNKEYRDGDRTSEFNDDGNFQVTQKHGDGSTSVITWQRGEGRSMIRVKQISQSGSVTEYATDGQRNMEAIYTQDQNGNKTSRAKRTFSFTTSYREKGGKPPISRKGKTRKDINLKNSMYTSEENDDTMYQFVHGVGNLDVPGFK